jgi:hypothetical protein
MSDKSPLQSFIAAHPRFHLAILLGEVGVSGAVQAATQGDTISLAVLQAMFTEIVTRRMEAEIGAEMEPQVPPESIH